MSELPYFLRTRHTGLPIFRSEALEYAEEIYGNFLNIDTAECLAKLSLATEKDRKVSLKSEDFWYLYRADCFKSPEYPANIRDTLTIKGIVAVDMVSADIVDDELEFYLQEPFEGLNILNMIHASHQARKLEL